MALLGKYIVRDLGVDVSLAIMNDVERVEANVSRAMNEYSPWTPPFISSRVDELATAKESTLRL
jgi:hypothetical protein